MSIAIAQPTPLPVKPTLRLIRSFPAMPTQVYPPTQQLLGAPVCADCGKAFLLDGRDSGRTSMRAPVRCRQCRNVRTVNSRQDWWVS